MSVSKEAVEETARAMCDDHKGDGFFDHERTSEEFRDSYRRDARSILTAALPHLLAAKDAEIARQRAVYEEQLDHVHGLIAKQDAEIAALREAVIEAFDLGYAWRGTLVGQTLEDSRAVGRTLCGDLFRDLPLNVNAVPSFATADAGIVAAKSEIKRALARAALEMSGVVK